MSAISPRLCYDQKVANYNSLSIITTSQLHLESGKKVMIRDDLTKLGPDSWLYLLSRDILGIISFYLVDKRHTQFRELQTNSPFDANSALYDPSFENLRVSFKEYNATQAALRELINATHPPCSFFMTQKLEGLIKKNHINLFGKFLEKVQYLHHSSEGVNPFISFSVDFDLKTISLKIENIYHQIIGSDEIDYLACKNVIYNYRALKA